MTGWLGELKLYGMVLVVISIVCLTARSGGRSSGDDGFYYYPAANPELYRRATFTSHRSDRTIELAPPGPGGLLALTDDDDDL